MLYHRLLYSNNCPIIETHAQEHEIKPKVWQLCSRFLAGPHQQQLHMSPTSCCFSVTVWWSGAVVQCRSVLTPCGFQHFFGSPARLLPYAFTNCFDGEKINPEPTHSESSLSSESVLDAIFEGAGALNKSARMSKKCPLSRHQAFKQFHSADLTYIPTLPKISRSKTRIWMVQFAHCQAKQPSALKATL